MFDSQGMPLIKCHFGSGSGSGGERASKTGAVENGNVCFVVFPSDNLKEFSNSATDFYAMAMEEDRPLPECVTFDQKQKLVIGQMLHENKMSMRRKQLIAFGIGVAATVATLFALTGPEQDKKPVETVGVNSSPKVK